MLEKKDFAEISKLADALRGKTSKSTFQKCILTLSPKLITNLNEAINLFCIQDDLPSRVRLCLTDNINEEHRQDVKFLYSMIQQTRSLKLVQDCYQAPVEDVLDISKFSSLNVLQLNKVKSRKVNGIRKLRNHIEFLSCVRSMESISEILEKCGADESSGHIWDNLKEIEFRHNNLQSLEASFEFTPWLHTLDLSHNELEDVRPLNCLYNLKNLNLGFNKLTSIPFQTFTGQICNRLQVVILSNNFIEDVTGLMVLLNVRELDLSENCILQHSVLAPLANLAALQWLSVEGNPISYHFDHRTLTAHNLHKNAASVQFMLDKQVMTKRELKHVGSVHPIRAKMPLLTTSPSSSSVQGGTVERSRRTRHATISDDNEKNDQEESFASLPSLATSMDHLETRRQIEELKNRFGSSWLYKEGGSMVQDILHLPKSSYPKTSSPYEADFLIHAKEVLEARAEEQERLSSGRTPPKDIVVHKPKGSPVASLKESKIEDNTTTEAVTALMDQNDERSGPTTYESANDELSDGSGDSLYPGSSVSSTESMFDLGEGDDSIFIVTIKDQPNPLFFIIGEKFLAERDAVVNAKEKTKWDLNSLTICQLKDGEPPYVYLEFDTIRTSRRTREYILNDEDETQKLLGKLNKIIAEKPPEKLLTYKCITCDNVFNVVAKLVKNSKLECPKCSGTFVYEEQDEEEGKVT